MDKNCTVYRTVDLFAKRWTLLILLELHKGQKRYSILKQKLIGITPKILSARLRELEKNGLVNKKEDRTRVPIKCEYSLTESGEDFIKVIQDIKLWALKWKFQNKECAKSDCGKCEL